MNQRQAAFTLIELLVVVAIIAVLAGLAFPVFGRMQENSRTVKCANNLRQIGAALLLYAGDNNGTLPLAGAVIDYVPPGGAQNSPLGWTQQLEPYLGLERDVYACPSSKKVLPNNKTYGYFMGCHAAYFATQTASPVRLPLLAVPSKYILGGDITEKSQFTVTDADKDDYSSSPAFATRPSPFHNGKVNLLFADGHVGAFAAFDPTVMTTHYDLKTDGTGYDYTDE